jgi:hypothetical protein
MYDGAGGSSDDLSLLGIPVAAAASFAPQVEVELWPEHGPALELFAALATQWRVGMSGATGLDYSAIAAVMDVHGIAPEDRRERFDELRIMEREALDVMVEKAKAK